MENKEILIKKISKFSEILDDFGNYDFSESEWEDADTFLEELSYLLTDIYLYIKEFD